MKLDLGCGTNKQPGYIGADRFKLPGVDVVCDMNKKLPFKDHSVQRVMASHALEHVNDLMFTMQEIYRVCQHKAIVCILAPYSQTSLNVANPYHKHHFNEHTPRFFTKQHDTRIPASYYRFPFITQWGLGESENSMLRMDFRCIRMEFFYFPQYLKLPEAKQRLLRECQWNVCDQIMYHLVVVKNTITAQELERLAAMPLEVPKFVEYRRSYERGLK
jgi:SAM-dependent methyltransferase